MADSMNFESDMRARIEVVIALIDHFGSQYARSEMAKIRPLPWDELDAPRWRLAYEAGLRRFPDVLPKAEREDQAALASGP